TQSKPATSRIVMLGASYVRRDGIVVGTPTEVGTLSLESGIWQYADGSYPVGNVFAFAGSSSPDVVGSAAGTCNDWTSTAGNSSAGFPIVSNSQWWTGGAGLPCANTTFPPVNLYCLRPAGTDAAAA